MGNTTKRDGTTRRDFLAQTAVGVAGASVLSPAMAEASQAVAAEPQIPPHRATRLPGVHAYAEKSIAAGETVHFRISSSVPYQLSVCRLAGEVDDRASDVVMQTFDRAPALPQSIHPGSYVHVDRGLQTEELQIPKGLSFECWVRPWRLDTYQGLITQHNYPDHCTFGLFINGKGQLQFYLGDGQRFVAEHLQTGPQLKQRQWQHVVGTWDGQTKSLWVDGKRVGSWPFAGPVRAGNAPLRLAAYGKNALADHFLDGDLAVPVVYGRALTAAEIAARFAGQGLALPFSDGVLGCWPLDEERGAVVRDAGRHGRHGRIINHATWMIGGPGFDSQAVPRFGSYDPKQDPQRGHGLRFASDDLYDCRWKAVHNYRMPESARSGVYIGKFQFQWKGKPHEYHVTFVVKKGAGRPPAPTLMLCSSNTWLAYSATPFAANVPPRQNWGTGGLRNSVDTAPAYCCYRDHHAGQPTYQVGLKMPWPSAGPEVLYSSPDVGYSHLTRAELFAHAWLEKEGYDFDVVTDYDLHRNPELLDGRKVLCINGHSEYWSAEAYTAVDRFLERGGNAIVMSGNTMFWRVSFDDEGTVMECRKYDPAIGGRQAATVGELFHSHDGRRGSLMRECGRPAWKVVGLECIGWWGTNKESIGVYTTDDPDHFLLNQPEKAGLVQGETFGHAPGGGLPMAVGHETDVRPFHVVGITRDNPFGVSLPEDPAGITTLATSRRRGTRAVDYFGRWIPVEEFVSAEVIYWERPQGGRVLHAGSIAAGWALSADPKLQVLMRNALHHFGVTR